MPGLEKKLSSPSVVIPPPSTELDCAQRVAMTSIVVVAVAGTVVLWTSVVVVCNVVVVVVVVKSVDVCRGIVEVVKAVSVAVSVAVTSVDL